MSLGKSKKIDATTGNLWISMIRYMIPLVIGTLIQNCFNAIDLMVLGNMADSNAVASVGATGNIVGLVVNTFIGVVGGCKIILAHQFGAKDGRQIKTTVDTAVITALGIGIVVAILGVPLAPGILHLTNCPEECFAGAVVYIRIYVAAAPAILLYNFGSAVLNASGDSQRPLYYIIISGLVNVVLNVILCLCVSQKVLAVAVATAASQVVGAGLVLRRLTHMEGDGRLEWKTLRFDGKAFARIMKQGLPLALNTAIYPLANLQIQSAINTFGVSAIAGNSAGSTIEGVPAAFNGSLNSTAVVFIGQNLGAGDEKRAKQSFRYCMIMGLSIGLVLATGIYATGRFWLSFFLPNDPAGIEYGMIRMTFVLLFYPVAFANGVLSASLQSRGYALYTSFSSIMCICVFRTIWMQCIYPHFGTFPMLMACFSVSWCLNHLTYEVGYHLFCKNGKSRSMLS